MNEEQLEAHADKLEKINRKMHKEDGWAYGTRNESRKVRLKRLRRWNKLEGHYPDKFVFKETPDRSHSNFKLVEKLNYKGVELFITSTDRKVPKWSEDPECNKEFYLREFNMVGKKLLPYEEWPTITQYNGYCRFKTKPVIEEGYNGIISYVPVHGGITFAQHELGVSTYGFDTAHYEDETNPLCKNIEWVGHQCAIMAMSIKVAAQFEPEYLKYENQMIRVWVLDRFQAKLTKLIGTEFKLTDNFGAMLNVLSGKI